MYNVTVFPTVQLNEPRNIYFRSNPSNKKYIPGNSQHTYRIITEALGRQKPEGCWIMLFDNASMLKHKQKLGTTTNGFGDPRNVLQLALQHQCLSMVLVSHSVTTYTASRTDLIYNLNLIAAANNISICLLDHIVTHPEGYYSYRDNGLLTYMDN